MPNVFPGKFLNLREHRGIRSRAVITKSVIMATRILTLTPEQLRSARQSIGLTQQQAAERLRISQAYIALVERGRRQVTARLQSAMAKLYCLGPIALPIDAQSADSWNSSSLAAALGALSYPGFKQIRGGRKKNPAVVLLATIAANDVEVRIVEALPWLAIEYIGLDWEWLIRESKARDLQNRLGFIVTVARQVAERKAISSVAIRLRAIEDVLDRSRLVREDTLCQGSLSDAERRWLREARPVEAGHWNLLTDLQAGFLPYAA